MTDRPAPMVAPDVDLRDFQFMPLDIVRLFGSRFHAIASDSEWRAGVTLWCKSFHQSPAASLPDDDIELCRLAELGRDMKSWKRVKNVALHGWVLCSDGRWYHPVVAEKANEAWQRKQIQRARSVKGNAARWGSRDHHGDESGGSEGASKERARRPQAVPGESQKESLSESHKESHKHPKGQGQGSDQDSGTIVPAALTPGDPPTNVTVLPVPSPPDARETIWRTGVRLLTDTGVAESTARAFLASLCKTHGEIAVGEKVAALALKPAADPRSWLRGALNGTHREGRPGGSAARVEAANRARPDPGRGDLF